MKIFALLAGILPLLCFPESALAVDCTENDAVINEISLMTPDHVYFISGGGNTHQYANGIHFIHFGGWGDPTAELRYDIPHKNLSNSDCLLMTIQLTNLSGALHENPLSIWYFDDDWGVPSNKLLLPEISNGNMNAPITLRIPMSSLTNANVEPSKFKDFFITLQGDGNLSGDLQISNLSAYSVSADSDPPPVVSFNSFARLGTLDVIEVTIDDTTNDTTVSGADFPTNWSLSSETDSYYKTAQLPTDVGRFTFTRDVVSPNGESLGPEDVLLRHVYYLHLPKGLQIDQEYTIRYNDPLPGSLSWNLLVGSGLGASHAIKINQLGYLGGPHERYAYIGYWMGSLGTYNINAPLDYTITRLSDKAIVQSGESHDRGFDVDSGEVVHEVDLSDLENGLYYLEVEDIGRSHLIRIGGTAFESYFHALRGLYHERCGTALLAEHTPWARPICHESPYKVDTLEDWSLDFPEDTPQTNPTKIVGGWHDAGDFDRRPLHLTVVEHLLILAEMFPDKLAKSPVNIPESGNELPDPLDEALYGLELWLGIQNPDGGVRAGTQSYRHPLHTTADGDELPYWIYSANRWTSYEFAATAAHAARLLEEYPSGYAVLKRKILKEAAKSAWNWAEAQTSFGTTSVKNDSSYGDELKAKDIQRARLFASGQLFALTGDNLYQSIFKSLWPELKAPTDWRGMSSLWAMAVVNWTNTESTLQNEVINRILESADQYILHTNDPKNKYRNARKNDYGIYWGDGTNTIKFLAPAIMAYHITPNSKYIDAVSLNADFQLGAHPGGQSWITGLGYYPPEDPLQHDSLYDTITEPVPGIPITGPFQNPYDPCSPDTYWKCFVYNFFDPVATNDYLSSPIPRFRHYSPWHGMADMNEFTVWMDMAFTALAYGFLYAVSDEPAQDLSQLTASDFPRNPGMIEKTASTDKKGETIVVVPFVPPTTDSPSHPQPLIEAGTGKNPADQTATSLAPSSGGCSLIIQRGYFSKGALHIRGRK